MLLRGLRAFHRRDSRIQRGLLRWIGRCRAQGA
jgi:hypothetical protein